MQIRNPRIGTRLGAGLGLILLMVTVVTASLKHLADKLALVVSEFKLDEAQAMHGNRGLVFAAPRLIS